MNKDRLTTHIIEVIDTLRSIDDREENVFFAVQSLINPLKPKNREEFAKWGHEEDQSTPDKCWD